MALHIIDDAAADALLTDNPLAPLDRHARRPADRDGDGHWALKIEQRTGSVDAAALAAYEPDDLAAVFKETPAVHRFLARWPRASRRCATRSSTTGAEMPRRCTRPAADQEGAPDGATVLKRLKALPGFGEQKAKIFLALLGKQYGFTGAGWREASAPYGEEGSHRSVADIVSPESLTKVRDFKRATKAAAKG
ncbi:MAG: HhH-GPD-type base excision DNA repair protein [Microbacterium sp.]